MKPRVVVTGLGVVSALGAGREAFFAALAAKKSAIRPHEGGEGATLAAAIDDFGARQHIEPRVLRRLARLSQMALLAGREALAQARGEGPGWPAERIGIVFGTGLGTLRESIDFMKGYLEAGPEAASPLLFPASVLNAAAGQVSIELGLRGPNTTINHRDASPLDALMLAADWLALGRADALLVGGGDELSAPALHGYRRLGALSERGMRPYARDADGTVLGEGVALLVVEREEDAVRRGARILARIAGHAASGEARARVGWHGEAGGAVETIREALAAAEVRPDEVDYVAGAGCGLAIDALEARSVLAALGRAAPHGSILGQTGDFLAAGSLRLASAVYALERQALPGTAGAGEPPPDAPVPALVREPRAARVHTVLVPQLAQAGSDAAVVLRR